MVMKTKDKITYFVLACIIVAFGVVLLRPSEGAKADYRELMQKAKPISVGKLKKDPFIATHQRIGVCKDVFYLDGGQRLHMRVESDRGDIVYESDGSGLDIIEELMNVKCTMQEELFYVLPDGREVVCDSEGSYRFRNGKPYSDRGQLQPMQLVRYIEAEKASYYITKDSLKAGKAEICRYRLPGHELCEVSVMGKLLMKGVADQIDVQLSDKGIQFHAKGLKGKISFKLGGERG